MEFPATFWNFRYLGGCALAIFTVFTVFTFGVTAGVAPPKYPDLFVYIILRFVFAWRTDVLMRDAHSYGTEWLRRSSGMNGKSLPSEPLFNHVCRLRLGEVKQRGVTLKVF